MSNLDDYRMPESYGTTIGKCLTFAEIEGLLAAERERCAAAVANPKTAGDLWVSMGIRNALAEMIRSLPPQTEGGVVSLCKAKR